MSRRKREGRYSKGNSTPSQVKDQSDVRPVRKLDDILRALTPLEQRGKVTQFLNSTEDVNKLAGLVEDIHNAMMDYQVCLQSAYYCLA